MDNEYTECLVRAAIKADTDTLEYWAACALEAEDLLSNPSTPYETKMVARALLDFVEVEQVVIN